MLIKGLSNLTDKHRPSVVSIGNYDGVHLGHQYLVESLLAKSTELQVPSTIITFEPLAKEFFSPESALRLTSLQQRANLLMELGVDQVLCIDFTQELADYSPSSFVKEILIDGLGVQHLCVGDDFRFGRNRAGDFEFLLEVGKQQGFCVAAHDTFELNQERVSSGRVRQALVDNDFDLAAQLLGRPYAITGNISRGQQLGRTINFPTANLELGNYNLAVNGVFAVTCLLNHQHAWTQGVANIGKRPTVDGKRNRLEVHLFDFDQDIYGQDLQVILHKKIRDEQKFDSVDDLKCQIQRDVQSAKEYFKKV
ncbi:bifunctional riboflavin kinase/FAD synthetase [Arenicella sp.]|nr:bifunctional riboflavin kinase/FAD synthetase [Arenicella sp.]